MLRKKILCLLDKIIQNVVKILQTVTKIIDIVEKWRYNSGILKRRRNQ